VLYKPLRDGRVLGGVVLVVKEEFVPLADLLLRVDADAVVAVDLSVL
jgi:hypothetical protein